MGTFTDDPRWDPDYCEACGDVLDGSEWYIGAETPSGRYLSDEKDMNVDLHDDPFAVCESCHEEATAYFSSERARETGDYRYR